MIGDEFDVDVLADVVGRDPEDVLDALDSAAAANLVIEIGVDRHRFAHALVRETLHEELSSSRRARQHRKVADALEARHADDIDEVVTELATHWAEASAGGDPKRAIELARGGVTGGATLQIRLWTTTNAMYEIPVEERVLRMSALW